MDAISQEGSTAAVLHSPHPPSPGGITDAQHEAGPQSAAGGMQKSGHVGTSVLETGSVLGGASALRLAVEGLVDGGYCRRQVRQG